MAVLIQLQFDVGTADQAQAAVRAVHQEVSRLNLATGSGAGNLGTFRSHLTQTGTAGRMAGEHMHMLRGALISLAEQGTGTTGVMGRLAAGLLQFGAGSAIVVGVAAGIAVLGLAYRAFTKDTDDAKKAQQDFYKELAKVGPFAAQRSAIGSKQEELAALMARRAIVEAPRTLREQKEFDAPGRVAALQDIDTQIAKLRTEMGTIGQKLAADIGEKLKVILPPVFGAAALAAFDPNLALRVPALRGAMPMRRDAYGVTFPGGAPAMATGDQRYDLRARPDLLPGYEPKNLIPIVTASFSAIAAVASGGGAGAAMAGLGNVLSQIKGLGPAGMVVSGIGSLFSLFDSGGGMPVKVTNFKDLEGIQQPSRTELLIVDSSGRPIERLMYDIGRRDARDVNPRLPVTAGT